MFSAVLRLSDIQTSPSNLLLCGASTLTRDVLGDGCESEFGSIPYHVACGFVRRADERVLHRIADCRLIIRPRVS